MSAPRVGATDPAAAKLYLLVRRDLSRSMRNVQAAHAAIALVVARGNRLAPVWGRDGPPIVLLGVESASGLAEWLDRLGAEAVPFREPDLGGALTAIAYWGPAAPEFAALRLL